MDSQQGGSSDPNQPGMGGSIPGAGTPPPASDSGPMGGGSEPVQTPTPAEPTPGGGPTPTEPTVPEPPTSEPNQDGGQPGGVPSV